MHFRIETLPCDHGALAVLHGRLDERSHVDAERELVALVAGAGQPRLVLDCAGLEYLSSAGLRALISSYKRMKARGGAIALCELRPDVREIIEISGLRAVFQLHGTRAEALA
jgi:anti-anti-sigma factor